MTIKDNSQMGISISLTLSKQKLAWCTQQLIEQGLAPSEENLSTLIENLIDHKMETVRSGSSYVYELCYPESMGGQPFYVGKGRGERYKDHAMETRRGGTSPKCKVIRSIWEKSEQVVVKMVQEHLHDLTAMEIEKARIYEIGYENLVNVPPRTKDTSYKGERTYRL